MSNQTNENMQASEKSSIWDTEFNVSSNDRQIKFTLAHVANAICQSVDKPTFAEANKFAQICVSQNLNPYLDVSIVKYGNQSAQIIVGKDAFEKRANSHPNFKGYKAGVIVLRGEEVKEIEGSFYLPTDQLVGGWCEVYRKDREFVEKITVGINEYIGRKKSGEVTTIWKNKPGTMIRKVAKAQALREAFPDTLSSLYISEEMDSENEQSTPGEGEKDANELTDLLKDTADKSEENSHIPKTIEPGDGIEPRTLNTEEFIGDSDPDFVSIENANDLKNLSEGENETDS